MYFNLRTQNEKTPFWRTKIPAWLGVFIVILSASGAVWLITAKKAGFEREMDSMKFKTVKYAPKPPMAAEEKEKEEWRFSPGPVSMELVKTKGCVVDGFLSNYGDASKELSKMIKRSECVYLHRALETWLRPPKFDQAMEIMEKVGQQPLVYGMFLAEAISLRRSYNDPDNDHDYKFKKMCRAGTENRWGEGTCVPNVGTPEYRRYLKSITRRAMDIGIQSFMFGQIELQDPHPNFNETEIKEIIGDMRAYAKKKGMDIIIGAQTNDITDEKYLRLFDYIEGGVGIDNSGQVENGPCLSKFSSCWGLLWNERYKSRANNVLVHLDWSGLTWDDMGIFARMPQKQRIKTLKNLYQKFTGENVGFLMPFLAVLSRDNGGCHGPKKSFYAASKKFGCKDETMINEILRFL